jgi:hypothetical protein
MPVIRILEELDGGMGGELRVPPLTDKVSQGADGSESDPSFLHVSDLDAVAFFDQDHQFHRIQGVQAETLSEKGIGIANIVRLKVLQFQVPDQNFLEFAFELLHACPVH